MKQAHGFTRFSAYIIDLSILIAVYYLCLKVAENLIPPDAIYPPATGMDLYSKKDFEVYKRAVSIAAIMFVIYHLFFHFLFNATLGQLLLKIRVLNTDGTKLDFRNKLRLTLVGLIKFSIIFLPSPMLIFFLMIGFPMSLLILLWAMYALAINPLLSYYKDDKASWSERLTYTRIFEKE